MSTYTYWKALDKDGNTVGIVASSTITAACDLADATWPGVVGIHFSHQEVSE